MGVVLTIAAISDERIAAFSKNPSLALDFLDMEEDGPGELSLDLDKSWDAIHFVLTEQGAADKPPNSFLLHRSAEFDAGLDWENPWALPSAEVRAFADFLESFPEGRFRALCDFKKMKRKKIHPDFSGDPENEKDTLDNYLLPNFFALTRFARAAAERGQGALFRFC